MRNTHYTNSFVFCTALWLLFAHRSSTYRIVYVGCYTTHTLRTFIVNLCFCFNNIRVYLLQAWFFTSVDSSIQQILRLIRLFVYCTCFLRNYGPYCCVLFELHKNCQLVAFLATKFWYFCVKMNVANNKILYRPTQHWLVGALVFCDTHLAGWRGSILRFRRHSSQD